MINRHQTIVPLTPEDSAILLDRINKGFSTYTIEADIADGRLVSYLTRNPQDVVGFTLDEADLL